MRVHCLCWLTIVVSLDLISHTSTQKMSKDALVEVEANLMSLLGLKRKPNVDKLKVVIPDAIINLYQKQTGLDTASIPRPGLYSKNANTVRSFQHSGR